MASDGPVLDGRDREDILSWMKAIAPHYVDNWDPEKPDAGTTLFEIFADLAEDVVERLDQVPEKQQAVFFNALEFDPLPPQSSRLPVQFLVDDSATENIPIPPQTTTTAPATDDRDEQIFETAGEHTFEATPASVTAVYGVDPGTDRILDHGDALDTSAGTKLFTGENCQRHQYYVGHSDLLNLNPGATVELELSTNVSASIFQEYVSWEYFGDNDAGEEGWHDAVVHSEGRSGTALSMRQQVEAFVEQIDPTLSKHGYDRVADEDDYELLLCSFADEIAKGTLSSPRADGLGGDETLPSTLIESTDLTDSVVGPIRQRLAALQQRLQAMVSTTQFERTLDSTTLTIEIPGEVTATEVEGVESRWLRCRIPETELAPPLFDIRADAARISVGADTASSSSSIPLDEAVTNDVSLDLTESDKLLPFGSYPTDGATFLFACEEAFTKPGATVTLHFEADEARDERSAGPEPALVWEYWNGSGWRRLSVEDGTSELQSRGTVTFEVPVDCAPSSEMGADRHWLRTRLVRGNYGEFRVENPDEEGWQRSRAGIIPPIFDSITVSYAQSSVPFTHQFTVNNLTVRDVSAEQRAFRLFEPPAGERQTLYLGFDQQLRGGPLQLYLPMERAVYPHEFSPLIEMEYCRDPASGAWARLDLQDNTADLTEEGLVAFSLPEPTTAFELFGQTRHWVRIRLSGDEFTRTARRLFERRTAAATSHTSLRTLSSDSIATREQNDQTQTPPTLHGLYLNTDWARNAETIDDEILGSSSGTANQEFSFDRKPVLEATVWVNELGALTQQEQLALTNDDNTAVDERTDADGVVTAFWVRWTGVESFLQSAGGAREYVINRTEGTVTFGNGHNGQIPDAGENNIRAAYQTGGGDDGDVAVGAVSSLQDEIPLIEEVTNPGPGEIGEPAEPADEFVSRVPKKLRDRGKPVTTDGFERIAHSAAREIETVRCRAGKDETGDVGKVTLLVVPDVDTRKPVPSETLITQVEAEIQQKAPHAVVGDGSKLTVRCPSYIEVSVSASVETTGTHSVTDVQDATESALEAFLHPLSGGPTGEGWEIGSAPAPPTMTTHLEGLDPVTRVTNITVRYAENGTETILTGDEAAPIVPLDVLIYSGRHDVTVAVRRDR